MSNIQLCLAAIRGLDLTSRPTNEATQICDVSEGGYMEFSGLTYRVDRIFRYLEVKWASFKTMRRSYWVTELELFDVLTGQKKYLEWEIDDELEICETLRNVRLAEITCDGQPLTRQRLEAIADDEEGVVMVAGTQYHYSDDDSWAALFYRQADASPLQVRMYEFYSPHDQYLTVELWEDGENKPEREAFISRPAAKHSAIVLQAGPATSAA